MSLEFLFWKICLRQVRQVQREPPRKRHSLGWHIPPPFGFNKQFSIPESQREIWPGVGLQCLKEEFRALRRGEALAAEWSTGSEQEVL